MELTISAEGDEQVLEQFYHWLRQDVDVVRTVKISTTATSDTGHMGAVEVVCMSIGTLTGLANLGVAWASFLRSRKAAPPIQFIFNMPLTEDENAMVKCLNLPVAPGDDD
ncbi:hypothetical protein ACFVYA_37660 [Amycolatopsis sp. NPDC058278]|uniref:effector-associated constant component EACC1 n=1 Tax=Amycolatopsis sp. NPDC058278 TaxID=3346417 RepID=UPI0036DE3160